MIRAVALILAGFASGAQAQGIALDVTGAPAGLVAVYQRANGDKFNITYLGQRGGEYVFEFRNGDTGAGSVTSTSYHNADGQRVRRVGSNVTWT